MAKARTRRKPPVHAPSPLEAWSTLTWTDLDEWAGGSTVSRGRSYQRSGRVSQLCLSESGTLLAWVRGRSRYATRVELDATTRAGPTRLTSACSCPVGFACKHAVAVIVELLEAIQDGASVPRAPDGDRRLALIEGKVVDVDDDEDDEWEGDSRAGDPSPGARAKRVSDRDIRDHLASRSSDELVDLVMQACQRDRELRKSLVDAYALADGRLEELLSETRAELRSLTAEEAWRNSWTGDGHLPDYSRLERRLKFLLDRGQADAVLQLGEELLRRGSSQLEESHDDGETACAIGACMEVACEALLRSSRGDADKILYAIDLMLADDFGICDAFAAVGERRWRKAVWSAVADRLGERLDDPAASDPQDEWSVCSQRRRLANWAIAALDKAGRGDEATERCVVEARASKSYPGAVRRLIDAGDADRAADLAREGLEATEPGYPAVEALQDLLCEIAASRGDWLLPAALVADRYFGQPCVSAYRELVRAAERTDHLQVVRSAALAFLEGGPRPDRPRGSRAPNRKMPPWPLPEPPRPRAQGVGERQARVGPHFDVLIDLAIDEKRPNDVLAWFDKRSANEPPAAYRWQRRAFRDDARVARAVEGTHPNRSIDLYLRLANAIAAETNPQTYPETVTYLKRVRSLLKDAGREQDWTAIVGGFRTEHRRKRRLMEALDGLEGEPIVKRGRR